jgi:hypothetical protein
MGEKSNANPVGGVQEEKDFGFVEREGEVVDKALTRSRSLPSLPDEADNKETGSEGQQVDNDSSLSAPETTGNDGDSKPDVEEDVSSITTLESAGEDGIASGDEVSDQTDSFNLRKLGGTLQDFSHVNEIGHVYDASKRKATVAKLSSHNPPGILRNMSSGSESPHQQSEGAAANKEDDLPQAFQVKYLGQRDARGLWGIKHTRRPVDAMVAAAKNLKAGTVLPIVRLLVSKEGVSVAPAQKKVEEISKFHPIDTISYGVQDLVYTRVFSMIIVKEIGELKGQHPFECHAFVCESRNSARKLTYALASAFNEYSKIVKARTGGENVKDGLAAAKKKFAIDLRSPEEIEADLNSPQAEDSEA